MHSVISAELIRATSRPNRPHPWVARITGTCERFGYQRDFLRGVYDYTYARGKRGNRGTYVYWFLEPGVYDVYRPISWKHEERFCIHALPCGSWFELTKEGLECLVSTIWE